MCGPLRSASEAVGAEISVTLQRVDDQEPPSFAQTFRTAPFSAFTEFIVPLSVSVDGDYQLTFSSNSGQPASIDSISIASGPGLTTDVLPPQIVRAKGGTTAVVIDFSEPIARANAAAFDIPG